MDLLFFKDFLYLSLIISALVFVPIGWFVWAIQTDGWLVWFLDLGSWTSIGKSYKRRGWDIPLRGDKNDY